MIIIKKYDNINNNNNNNRTYNSVNNDFHNLYRIYDEDIFTQNEQKVIFNRENINNNNIEIDKIK